MRRTYQYAAVTKDEAQRSPSALLRAVSMSNGRWIFYEAVKGGRKISPQSELFTIPVMLKLYVGSRTGIITTLINGETVNISLEGMCVELGLSDYIDIISLVEAAMSKTGVGVRVKLIVGDGLHVHW